MPKSILTASAKFLVKSGTLVITDPGNDTPVVIENVKNGNWEVFIDMREDDCSRVEDICAYHSSADPEKEDDDATLEVAVDGGMVAICDAKYYQACDSNNEAFFEDMMDTADPFGSFYNGRGVRHGVRFW